MIVSKLYRKIFFATFERYFHLIEMASVFKNISIYEAAAGIGSRSTFRGSAKTPVTANLG
jgi:hypothetical protein